MVAAPDNKLSNGLETFGLETFGLGLVARGLYGVGRDKVGLMMSSKPENFVGSTQDARGWR